MYLLFSVVFVFFTKICTDMNADVVTRRVAVRVRVREYLD